MEAVNSFQDPSCNHAIDMQGDNHDGINNTCDEAEPAVLGLQLADTWKPTVMEWEAHVKVRIFRVLAWH